ncbi:MAG: agmatinase family protein [Bacteroidetes bacterium]|nr:agmatinase family protein [Bacteroidota bacterium]
MSLEEKIKEFNPNDLGKKDANIFGLPFTTEEARVVVVPVPWEVTVSYGGGTINGPEAVFDASMQVDLFDPFLANAWKLGVAMDEIPKKLKTESRRLRRQAERYIDLLASGKNALANAEMKKIQSEINAASLRMIERVKKTTAEHIASGKMVALIGGDHSTPLGFIKALGEKYSEFGVLQIDAHADLRDAYEGFTYSHASIMFNVLKEVPSVKKLVQAGTRDYCEDEVNVIKHSNGRVQTYFDKEIKYQLYNGKSIRALHVEIVQQLPKHVYISFDIDGLDPKLCPNTGTPVPGGFEFEEAAHLLQTIVESGRTIIGFDINEVSPGGDEWDANVGARLLYRMINMMAKSNGITSL